MGITIPKEMWVEYGLVGLVIVVRICCQIYRMGLKGLRLDDYIMGFAIPVPLINLYALTRSFKYGELNDLTGKPPGYRESLTQGQIHQITTSSIWMFVGGNLYMANEWILKICMIMFLNRVLDGLEQQKYIKWAWYVTISTYVVAVLEPIFACAPGFKVWQVIPDPGRRCYANSVLDVGFYTSLTCNILPDIAIIFIPLLLMFRVRMPFWKKFRVVLLFSLGIFSVACYLTRTLMVLGTKSPITAIFWGVHEILISTLVCNIPMIHPVVTELFNRLRNNKTPEEIKMVAIIPLGTSKSAARRRNLRMKMLGIYGGGTTMRDSRAAASTEGIVRTTEVDLESGQESIAKSEARNSLQIVEELGREDSVKPGEC